MKKFLLAALFAGLWLNFALAEPQQQIIGTPTDVGNVEIIDLNITPAKSTFSTDLGTSISAKEGTFVKMSVGEGSGASKDEATRNAISDALGRLKGISVSNASLKTQKFGGVQTGTIQSFNPQTYKAAQGRIDSYEITNIDLEPNGSYVVRVNVYKILFERNEKPNVVIFNASRYKNLGETLRQRLTNEMVQSKRFNVLDRKNDAYYKAEKALLQSEDASSEDLYKLGNVFGTDYMLVFNLRNVGASAKKSAGVAATNSTSTAVKGDIVVDYRMMLFATRELKLANTLNLTITLKDDSVKSNEEAFEKIAKAIFTDISNTLYPIFVAMVEKDEALFEEKLELGAIYECESKTNANSGRVQVTKANAKNSRAKIIDGEVALGDTCKLSLETGKAANYKLGTNGGVQLGW